MQVPGRLSRLKGALRVGSPGMALAASIFYLWALVFLQGPRSGFDGCECQPFLPSRPRLHRPGDRASWALPCSRSLLPDYPCPPHPPALFLCRMHLGGLWPDCLVWGQLGHIREKCQTQDEALGGYWGQHP